MPHTVDVTGYGQIDFPDTMSDDQIHEVLRRKFSNSPTPATDVAVQADPYQVPMRSAGEVIQAEPDIHSMMQQSIEGQAYLPQDHSPAWNQAQARLAARSTAAGLPPAAGGRDRLINAIQRSAAAGFPVQHFAGQPDEPTGDRAPTMDIENLVNALRAREKKDPSVAPERAYWEQELAQGMTDAQWQQQTGEPSPQYPIPGGPQVLSPQEEKAAVMNAPQWAQEAPGQAMEFARKPSPPWMQPAEKFLTEPRVSAQTAEELIRLTSPLGQLVTGAETLLPENAPTRVASGMVKGAGEVASSFSSLANLGLLAAIPEGTLAKVVAAGFTLDAFRQMPELYNAFMATNDPKEKGALFMQAAASMIPALGLRGGPRGARVEAKGPPSLPPFGSPENPVIMPRGDERFQQPTGGVTDATQEGQITPGSQQQYQGIPPRPDIPTDISSTWEGRGRPPSGGGGVGGGAPVGPPPPAPLGGEGGAAAEIPILTPTEPVDAKGVWVENLLNEARGLEVEAAKWQRAGQRVPRPIEERLANIKAEGAAGFPAFSELRGLQDQAQLVQDMGMSVPREITDRINKIKQSLKIEPAPEGGEPVVQEEKVSPEAAAKGGGEGGSVLAPEAPKAAGPAPIVGPALVDPQGNIIIQGQIGDTHRGLLDKTKYQGDEVHLAAIEAQGNDAQHAFVDANGNVLNREEAAKAAVANGQAPEGTTKLQSEHLAGTRPRPAEAGPTRATEPTPPAAEPPVEPGMVRIYHGSNAERAGRDFSAVKSYAQGYADKAAGGGGKVWYVDVPEGSLKTHDEYGLPMSRVIVPDEVSSRAKPLAPPKKAPPTPAPEFSRVAGAPAVPRTGVSVPIMITRAMEAELRSFGFNQEAIDHMTPQQANDNLVRSRAQEAKAAESQGRVQHGEFAKPGYTYVEPGFQPPLATAADVHGVSRAARAAMGLEPPSIQQRVHGESLANGRRMLAEGKDPEAYAARSISQGAFSHNAQDISRAWDEQLTRQARAAQQARDADPGNAAKKAAYDDAIAKALDWDNRVIQHIRNQFHETGLHLQGTIDLSRPDDVNFFKQFKQVAGIEPTVEEQGVISKQLKEARAQSKSLAQTVGEIADRAEKRAGRKLMSESELQKFFKDSVEKLTNDCILT